VVPLFLCIAQSMTGDGSVAGATLANGVKKFPEEPFLACQLLELEMQTSPYSSDSLPVMAAKINALAAKYPRYPQVVFLLLVPFYRDSLFLLADHL
jgi:hypothetical protein